jgi:hypothetical protein
VVYPQNVLSKTDNLNLGWLGCGVSLNMRPRLWTARLSLESQHTRSEQMASKVKSREFPKDNWILFFGRWKVVSLVKWKQPLPPIPLPFVHGSQTGCPAMTTHRQGLPLKDDHIFRRNAVGFSNRLWGVCVSSINPQQDPEGKQNTDLRFETVA